MLGAGRSASSWRRGHLLGRLGLRDVLVALFPGSRRVLWCSFPSHTKNRKLGTCWWLFISRCFCALFPAGRPKRGKAISLGLRYGAPGAAKVPGPRGEPASRRPEAFLNE